MRPIMLLSVTMFHLEVWEFFHEGAYDAAVMISVRVSLETGSSVNFLTVLLVLTALMISVIISPFLYFPPQIRLLFACRF